mmetsp:Transcript_709/g.1709  ORF Transcript_709/g.1709 Transcript_709/m.1709 type:complete len:211 (+) Transcript_709:1084-1716(+)
MGVDSESGSLLRLSNQQLQHCRQQIDDAHVIPAGAVCVIHSVIYIQEYILALVHLDRAYRHQLVHIYFSTGEQQVFTNPDIKFPIDERQQIVSCIVMPILEWLAAGIEETLPRLFIVDRENLGSARGAKSRKRVESIPRPSLFNNSWDGPLLTSKDVNQFHAWFWLFGRAFVHRGCSRFISQWPSPFFAGSIYVAINDVVCLDDAIRLFL